jgi:hypothetical protein
MWPGSGGRTINRVSAMDFALVMIMACKTPSVKAATGNETAEVVTIEIAAVPAIALAALSVA